MAAVTSVAQSSRAFSQAAAAALEQLQEQARQSQAEAATLRDENEALRRNFARLNEEHEKEAVALEKRHKEVLKDLQRLQDIVTELRKALGGSIQKTKELAGENERLDDQLRQLNVRQPHKANEWQAEASDSKEAARALYTQLAESESNAAKLIMALEEERMRGAKAAHLVREKSSALEQLRGSLSRAEDEAKSASRQAGAAAEATRVAEVSAEALRSACAEAEERARAMEAIAAELQADNEQLNGKLRQAEAAKGLAEMQLSAFKGRMAERIRTHEDRSKQAAMAAISSTREERDRAAEAAEVARSSEARARMLLEECRDEAEALRKASNRLAGELAKALGAAEEARRDAESARGNMEEERAKQAKAEAALRGAEQTMARVLDFNKGLMDGFLKVLDRNLGQAQPSKPPDASLYQMKSAPLSSSEAVCCQGRRAGLPGGGGGRGTPAQQGEACPSSSTQEWLPSAVDAGRPRRWEQLQNVLVSLEEELRMLDQRHDHLLRQQHENGLQRGIAASGHPRSQELAKAIEKVKQDIQRKGQQIAILRPQAGQLRMEAK